MKDVTSIVSIHSRMYPVDAIDLSRLLIALVNQQISQAMMFKDGNFDADKRAVQFQMGEYIDVETQGTYLIESFIIEERRVQLKLQAPSAVTLRCFEGIMEVLASQRVFSGAAPIVALDQSSMVATLDFHFPELFRPAVSGLASGIQAALEGTGAKPVVVPRSFAMEILFAQTEGELAEYIMREARRFTIEPRAQTGLQARRFFCAGPVDSDVMQRIVGELEAAVVAARQKA